MCVCMYHVTFTEAILNLTSRGVVQDMIERSVCVCGAMHICVYVCMYVSCRVYGGDIEFDVEGHSAGDD